MRVRKRSSLTSLNPTFQGMLHEKKSGDATCFAEITQQHAKQASAEKAWAEGSSHSITNWVVTSMPLGCKLCAAQRAPQPGNLGLRCAIVFGLEAPQEHRAFSPCKFLATKLCAGLCARAKHPPARAGLAQLWPWDSPWESLLAEMRLPVQCHHAMGIANIKRRMEKRARISQIGRAHV